MSEAEKVSREVERFIAYYIEEDPPEIDTSPTAETLTYRTALSDPDLGEFINRKVRKVSVACQLQSFSNKFVESVCISGGASITSLQQKDIKAFGE